MDASAIPSDRMNELAACPEGQLGVAAADLMALINDGLYHRAASMVPPYKACEPFELLEIGFGAGGGFRAALHVVRPEAKWVGLEKSQTMVRIQQALTRYEVLQGVAEELPFDRARFATVVALNTICWWDDPMIALSEIRRVLIPEGTVIINLVLPNAATKILEQGKFPRPHYYTPIQLANMLRAAGMPLQVTMVEEETIHVDDKETTRSYMLFVGKRGVSP